jgi:hypothetical protein
MPLEFSADILDLAEQFSTDDTPITRLGASLFVNTRFPEARLITFFTGFFDASGDWKDQPHVVVAGYIANWCQWRFLENQWRDIHKEFNIDIPFHASDFVASQENPERYAEQHNARPDYIALGTIPGAGKLCLRKLCVAQLSLVSCGVSSVIPLKIYDEIESDDLLNKLPPFVLGARMCNGLVRKWQHALQIPQPVECIFEKGDFGQGKFIDLMRDEGANDPIFKNKAEYAGLQAADHYAWEQTFFLKKELQGKQSPERPDFIAQLHMIPHVHGTHDANSFLEVCQLLGIEAKLRSKA